MPTTKYSRQRQKRIPPHVSLGVLRVVAGLTLEQVCARVDEHLGNDAKFTRGALSAIENGHRGASREVIEALEHAYGLQPGDISTNYLPRRTAGVTDIPA